MKKRLSALLCMLLAAAMLLASCSSDDGEVVMSYGEASVTENLYIYMLALGKSTVLQNFSGSTADIPALWDQEMGKDSNGEIVTYGKMSYIDQQLDIKTKLFFADYALSHGGELTDDEKKEIQSQLDTIINSEQFGGSEAALNKPLLWIMISSKSIMSLKLSTPRECQWLFPRVENMKYLLRTQ